MRMKIYTKRGDAGQTDLFGGQRVSKSNHQVVDYGKIDTANAFIGLIAAQKNLPDEIQQSLPIIMKDLFNIGAYLATAQNPSAQSKLTKHLANKLSGNDIKTLEDWIDRTEEQLEPLRHFILPTGCTNSAYCHLARAHVREAEIAIIQFMEDAFELDPAVLAYVNRLSDLLFVWARLCNYNEKIIEEKWNP